MSLSIPVSSEIWFPIEVRNTDLSACLKNRGTDSSGDGVDYDDPSLNGGRSRNSKEPRSRAYYVVNYGLIALVGLAVLALFLTA